MSKRHESGSGSPLSAEKRALMARRLREEGDARGILLGEPVAVTGMACRLPGGVRGPEDFWALLRDGRDPVGRVPPDRWGREGVAATGSGDDGGVSHGGFLDDVTSFDADFFGVPPREAASMDPQHRILMEVTWEALEDAGLVARDLRGSATGCFVGVSTGDYGRLLFADAERIEAYALSGTAGSLAANRLSYVLDWRGPSLSVDTACSSSLVALHLACQSLRLGECDTALAAGVNVMLDGGLTTSLARWGVLSPSGRCRTFDATADGFVRSEGCAVVVLRRLADALRDGDRILGVIRGSATNQDGRSNGLTAPSVPAQERVIRAAMGAAGVSPGDVDYVEAHGTGTALGDPIEMEALKRAFRDAPEGHRCLVGAAKASVGHTEAASGVVGLIKVLLMLGHREVPSQIHFETLNPAIDLEGTPFAIAADPSPWPVSSGSRRMAGLSGFGFGGTNVHVIVEEPPPVPTATPSPDALGILALSAATPEALEEVVDRHVALLRDPDAPAFADVCHTACAHRTHHPFRVAVAADTAALCAARLEDRIGAGLDPVPAPPRRPGVAFVFTGQGRVRTGAGGDLFRRFPVFRDAVEACDSALVAQGGRSVAGLLEGGGGWEVVDDPEVAQPYVFALQQGLVALLRSWDLAPDAVVGHSLGEISAACVAGALTLDEAAGLVVCRARAMAPLVGAGGMLAVGLTEEEARDLVASVGGGLEVGAVNGPSAVTLTGPHDALENAHRRLRGEGRFVQRLDVSLPFHSAAVEPAAEAVSALAAQAGGTRRGGPAGGVGRPSRHGPVLHSTVTGGRTPRGWVAGPAHWRANVRDPVLFGSAVRGMIEDGTRVFVEIGAHPGLRRPLLDGLTEAGIRGAPLATLRAGVSARAALLDTVASLHEVGVSPRWSALGRGRLVSLPSYPWTRTPHWFRRGKDGSPRAQLWTVTWSPSPSAGGGAEGDRGDATGDWWILSPTPGAGADVARALEVRGGRVEALPGSSSSPRGVILTGEQGVGSPDGEGVAESVARTVELLRGPSTSGAPVWLLAHTDAPVAQTASWEALLRSVAVERPELFGGIVRHSGGSGVEAAVDVLLGERGRWLRVDGGGAMRPTLTRLQVPVAELAPDPEAAYLISGGLGALGLATARWLVDAGARFLVLLGRSAPGADAAAALAEMEQSGAVVTPVAGNVADADDVGRALAAARGTGRRLAGVVHAAGVVDDALLEDLDPERIRRVMSGKATGARVLAEATRADALDFLVFYSSMASLMGAPGQSAYAAANGYLDGLATALRREGRPALSVQWGPWAAVGMAASDPAVQARRAAEGVRALDPSQALRALGDLLARGVAGEGRRAGEVPAVVAVMDVDWTTFRQRSPMRRSPLELPGEDMREAAGLPSSGVEGSEADGLRASAAPGAAKCRWTAETPPTQGGAPADALLEALEEAPPERRRSWLRTFVRREVAAVLGRTTPAGIDDRVGFSDLGMDSLMALELRNRAQQALRLSLPATFAFDFPCVADVADELDRLTPAGAAPSSGAEDARAEELGDDDVLRELARRLGGPDAP